MSVKEGGTSSRCVKGGGKSLKGLEQQTGNAWLAAVNSLIPKGTSSGKRSSAGKLAGAWRRELPLSLLNFAFLQHRVPVASKPWALALPASLVSLS